MRSMKKIKQGMRQRATCCGSRMAAKADGVIRVDFPEEVTCELRPE